MSCPASGDRTLVTVAEIADLLGVRSAISRAGLRTSLMPQHKLAETLVSTAQASGHPIGATGRGLLESYEHRVEYYRRITDDSGVAAVVLKGLSILDSYPAGIARGMVDLDLHCRDAGCFWNCAVQVHTSVGGEPLLALWQVGDVTHYVVAFERPVDGFEAPYRVEISTNAFPGDFATTPSRVLSGELANLPGPAHNLLLIAEEQFQRGIIGRDLVDCVYLMQDEALRSATGELARAAEHLGLVGQLHALVSHPLVDRHMPEAASDLMRALSACSQRPARRDPRPIDRPVQAIHLMPAVESPADRTTVRGDILLSPLGAFALTRENELSQQWMDDHLEAARRAWTAV